MKTIGSFGLRIGLTVLVLISLSSGCGRPGENAADDPEPGAPAAPGQTMVLQPESFAVQLPNSAETLAVQGRIPKGWARNLEFGTVVFQPADKDDHFDPPLLQYEVRCGGSCEPQAIPANIEAAVQGIKDRLARPNINTGDSELDAVRAGVEVLLDEKFGADGRILAAAVTYPEHLSAALYIPRVVVHAFLHRPGDGFFIQTTGRCHLNQKDELLPVLTEACKATSPGGVDDPQDAADLLQVPAPALGGARPGSGQDPLGLS